MGSVLFPGPYFPRYGISGWFCQGHSWRWFACSLRGAYPSRGNHIWELPVIHFHKIRLIYPYHFLLVITLLLSYIIFMNDSICILTYSRGYYLFMIKYVIQKNGSNKNSPDSLNAMVNFHYNCENRVITH